jgi:hypothetical protein
MSKYQYDEEKACEVGTTLVCYREIMCGNRSLVNVYLLLRCPFVKYEITIYVFVKSVLGFRFDSDKYGTVGLGT